MVPTTEASAAKAKYTPVFPFSTPRISTIRVRANNHSGTKNTTPQKNWRSRFWRENFCRNESIPFHSTLSESVIGSFD